MVRTRKRQIHAKNIFFERALPNQPNRPIHYI